MVLSVKISEKQNSIAYLYYARGGYVKELMELKEFNATHVARHAEDSDVRHLVNLLRGKISYTLKYGFSKIKRGNSFYFTKNKSSFFDIYKAIECVKEVQADPYWRYKDFNYQLYVDILNFVLVDRIKFGDSVPGTTDVWGEFYSSDAKVGKSKKYADSRKASAALKSAERKKFVEKFSQAEIIWS